MMSEAKEQEMLTRAKQEIKRHLHGVMKIDTI